MGPGRLSDMTKSAHVSRLVACYGAIAACVPYLTLKIAWLAGSGVGTVGHGTAEMRDTRHVVGNAVTVAMDLAAVVVALAFTYRWGRRLPAWLVLVPSWVATGLLAPIALGAPLGVLVQGFAGGSPAAADNGLRGWVYAIVYGGFTLQAVLLLSAFVLYARNRWAAVFRLRTADLAARSARSPLVTAVLAAGYGVLQVGWAVSPGVPGGDPAAVETATQQTFWATQGVLSIAGAVGLLALARRWGTGRLLAPLAATWVGSGVMVASGLYAATVEVGAAPVRLLGVVTGLLVGAATLRVLAGHSRTSPPQPANAVPTATIAAPTSATSSAV